MTNEADFYGDCLRLSAFLRITENSPRRPKRLNRDKQITVPATGDDGSPTAQSSSAEQSDGLRMDQNSGLSDEMRPDVESDAQYVAELSPPGDAGAPGAGSTSSVTSPCQLRQQTKCTNEEDGADPPTLQSPHGAKIVYTTGTKQEKQPMGVISTRRKHPLPVNGLVFVRASTEDGLPPPGDAEVAFGNPMLESDPIQDSQLGVLPNRMKKPQLSHDKHPPRVSKSSGSSQAKLVKSPQNKDPASGSNRGTLTESHHAKASTSRLLRGRMFAFSTRPLRTNARNGSKLPGLEAVSDGFVWLETACPAPRPRQLIKNAADSLPKMKNFICDTSATLQLVKGFLPPPGPISTDVPEASRSLPDSLRPQLEPIRESIEEGSFSPTNEHKQQHITYHHSQASASRVLVRSYSAEPSVVNQLSNVTAPAREDEESASSDSEQESDGAADRWGLGDATDPSMLDDSDCTGWDSSMGEDELADSWELTYGMNVREDAHPGLNSVQDIEREAS